MKKDRPERIQSIVRGETDQRKNRARSERRPGLLPALERVRREADWQSLP